MASEPKEPRGKPALLKAELAPDGRSAVLYVSDGGGKLVRMHLGIAALEDLALSFLRASLDLNAQYRKATGEAFREATKEVARQ